MDHELDHAQLQPEPLSPAAHQFEPWLTVSESVAYCSSKGLERTPKTIRKWAMRSHNDTEGAELNVRREDIETGFRWSIERSSLDRKIAQELDFERRNQGTQNHAKVPPYEPVRAGSTPISVIKNRSNQGELNRLRANQSDSPEPEQSNCEYLVNGMEQTELIGTLKEQIRRLDEQVDFYKEELRDRRTSTKALAEVIQAFRLNAENQANRQTQPNKHHDVRDPKRVEEGDNETGTKSNFAI